MWPPYCNIEVGLNVSVWVTVTILKLFVTSQVFRGFFMKIFFMKSDKVFYNVFSKENDSGEKETSYWDGRS